MLEVQTISRFVEEFILEKDLSDIKLGAVLSNIYRGKDRSLRCGEKKKLNYSSKKIELLAIVCTLFDRYEVSCTYEAVAYL